MEEAPHRKLNVWKKAVDLSKDIYLLTEKFPSTEKFGLVLQMRRVVVSIASNIAEGSARFSSKEKIQFFIVARGSISELDTQIEISFKLGYIGEQEKKRIYAQLREIGKMLNGLISSRRRKLL